MLVFLNTREIETFSVIVVQSNAVGFARRSNEKQHVNVESKLRSVLHVYSAYTERFQVYL